MLKQIERVLPTKWILCLIFQAEILGQSLVCAICCPRTDLYLNLWFYWPCLEESLAVPLQIYIGGSTVIQGGSGV